MFGMRVKPKGLFGQPGLGVVPGDQPDHGMGDFPTRPHNLPQTNDAPQKRGGVFGSGVPWGDVLYGMGGAIAGDGGAAIQQVQQRKLAPLMEQAKREAEWAYWQRKEQWKRDNPMPANNDTLNDMAAAATWTPEQWAIYDRLHPRYVEVDDGRGGKRIVPASSIGGSPNLPDTLPPDFFDNGGPASAPGGFPGGY